MSKPIVSGRSRTIRSIATLLAAGVAALLLGACVPTYSTRGGGYYGGQPAGYNNNGGDNRCYQGCGYVRDIREVRMGGSHDNAVVGTVIGALVGGALGNQVGKGDGRKAATVAGAVAGGFAGHAIGDNSRNGDYGWQIVVQLRDGQYATVTQRDPPRVRVGDSVMIRDNEVYPY